MIGCLYWGHGDRPLLLGLEKWGAWWDAEKEPVYVCSHGRVPETLGGLVLLGVISA